MNANCRIDLTSSQSLKITKNGQDMELTLIGYWGRGEGGREEAAEEGEGRYGKGGSLVAASGVSSLACRTEQ